MAETDTTFVPEKREPEQTDNGLHWGERALTPEEITELMKAVEHDES